MRHSVCPLLIFLFFIPSLHAFIEKRIDEKVPLLATFSSTSHNRISVAHGSVEKVFGDETLFSIRVDPTTGQAFVSLLQPLEKAPSTLTVVTSNGYVQDLLVTSGPIPSEQILLKEPQEESEEFSFSSSDYHTNTVNLLNEVLSGNIPLGYGKRELDTQDQLVLPPPLEATPIKALEDPFETMIVYRLRNKGQKPILIKADSFKNPSNQWVFLSAHELRFREEAVCIISLPKKQQEQR
ncbi:MAG: type-F conjugative transfer system secretin TraK [Simkania negevensis]|nr:type-F conjugative transfer system secretin TraK [Simkania negevensis]